MLLRIPQWRREGRCFILLKWGAFGGSRGSGRRRCCRSLSGLQYLELNTRGHKLSKSRLFSPGFVKASIETNPNTSRLRKANRKLYWKIKGKVNVVAVSEHRWKLSMGCIQLCCENLCQGTCVIHVCTGIFSSARRCGNCVAATHMRELLYIWVETHMG